MARFTTSFPTHGKLTTVPLAVAYVAVPLVLLWINLTEESRVAFSVIMPWMILAFLGLLCAVFQPKPDALWWEKAPAKGLAISLFVLALFSYAPRVPMRFALFIPYIMELTPLVFLLFSLLWAKTCGLPDRADFQRFGAILGMLCLMDCVMELILYGAIPTVRWIGNADILAGLLLVSLCAGLKPGQNEGGFVEPDQGRHWWRVIVMLGLLSCFSRTGLFAAGWVILCFGRGRLLFRILFTILCLFLICATFLFPTTASDAIRYADYWLWMEALRMLSIDPSLLLTGFAIPSALPVQVPMSMDSIWEAATGHSASAGIFLHQIPSFWLRITTAWGIFPPLALLACIFFGLLRRLNRMGAGLTAALFAQGMTTPLLYDPAMGISIGLGLILAQTGPSLPGTLTETQDGTTIPTAADTDSATEWDVRPL
ncbi:hypothetical protein [Pseudodesulfovibrio piezophilus]|uniref:O-antigen polymerase n=1 Tax=Pseudodesulfovibrio piezophilus (strain DSM 21447 / JCM 15486 / C1TLV30) TaxID=1322246 RepID=M1WWQ1_PSEP2|nr:hypothetical protein [Pseudodesulfovibrio piezophilus]CCH49258.1 conserved membrane protein of unknown function [Pseudodesulfovibrio piezophilus C1TLV30]